MLVIGAGGAGLRAAIEARLRGLRVGIVCKSLFGKAHTVMAEGGIAAAMVDVMADRVDVAIGSVGSTSAQLKDGRLHGLAISGDNRHPLLPAVPTFAEAGLSQVEATGWNGVFVPAGTPVSVINKIHAEITKVLSTPAAKARGNDMGYEYGSESPEEFGNFIKAEIKKWGSVMKDAKIKFE